MRTRYDAYETRCARDTMRARDDANEIRCAKYRALRIHTPHFRLPIATANATSIEENELFNLSIVGVGFGQFWADALARSEEGMKCDPPRLIAWPQPC